jgi:hypothetical protein
MTTQSIPPTPSTQVFTIGATVHNLYVEREVRVFAVHEFEYNSLSNMSTFATGAFALATASFAYAMGIWTNAAFADKLTPTGELATRMGAPILAIFAFVCLCAGGIAVWRRYKLWGTIKKQSSPNRN